uniref:Uncharacterized protein n=1 Tax=Canis lupus familiaris TaxID=9615 RepID=A0A8C0T449_CANLF
MNLENIIPRERNQIQKATYCMIPFIENVQNGQIHKDKNKYRVFKNTDRLGGTSLQVSFWGDENVLKLGGGGDCTTL